MITEKKYFLEKKLQEPASPIYIDEQIKEEVNLIIGDTNYFEFITSIGNGGFFFGQSLQFYSLTSENTFRSIKIVNELLIKEFSFLFDGLFAFAQDIFGNQFVFDKNTHDILFFNIESGSKQLLSASFQGFLNVLINDIDYYTGMSYEKMWKVKNDIALNQRLQAKIPFVIGGDYIIDNFYVNSYPAYLLYNADIAKQIYNLKDGEKVKLKLKS
jgi:hypothetical protein